MVSEFTVFGSCTCRDIFNSSLNKDYKKYFHISTTGIRLSFISIMQEPVEYPEGSLKLLPENKTNRLFSAWIKQDLDKTFLDELKKDKFEYMIIDTYYDTNFGIVDIGDGNYITNNVRLNQTDFFKNLQYKKFMKITYDTEKYLSLWKENCDLFFDFLENNCPDLKVILNPSRHTNRLLKEDGLIEYSKSFDELCKRFNPHRDVLDEYIIKNFDIDVLYFDDNIAAPEKHLWGSSSLHYENRYFIEVTNQLNDMIKRNSILNNNNLDELNQKFRKQNRAILSFKIFNRNKTKSKFNSLKYFKSIKNYNNLLKLNSSISDQIIQLKDDNQILGDECDFLLELNKEICINQIEELK